MKKRNLAITAFVLCATLVMAIGFAALSGTLNIGGTATFNGDNISSEILESVKFTNGTGDQYTGVSWTDTTATMTVNFYDLADDDTIQGGQLLEATATFTITYASDNPDAVLPAIQFAVPNPTISGTGFGISTNWDEVKTLAFKGTITITVTVTYEVPETAPTDKVSATITIPMPYATVA